VVMAVAVAVAAAAAAHLDHRMIMSARSENRTDSRGGGTDIPVCAVGSAHTGRIASAPVGS
jgi:hypothetical protein